MGIFSKKKQATTSPTQSSTAATPTPTPSPETPADLDRVGPVSYTHLTLPTSDLV